jgi:hypothetical protein
METSLPKRWSARKASGKVITWGAVAVLGGLFILMMLPPVSCVYSRTPRTECKYNLKALAQAMHDYHDAYHSFPPAYIADKDGRPMHCWRVLLLPFLESHPLYEQYRFDEPWNGPHNRTLASQMPSVFRCPSDAGPENTTSYLVAVGPKTIFPGAVPIRIRDITDGTSNTILLVEAADSGINWLEPRDMSYVEAVRGINPKSGWGISSRHEEGERGAQVALADGSVRFLPNETPVDQLRLFLERNDGQPVSWPRY